MGAPDLLARLSALGVRLSREGDGIRVAPRSALTDEARTLILEHKAELLAALPADADDDPLSDPTARARRQRVLAKLADNPALRIAVVCDGEGDPVPVAVAIRDKGTCEVLIPAGRFDPFALLDLAAKHGGALH
jgi:hypothetical protein